MVVSFDHIAEKYDETRGFPIIVMDKIIKTLKNELEEHESILDVGMGTARFSKPLQDRGYYVVGIDVSLKMLKKAVEKGMRDLLMSSVCNLPFKDYSFDATISTGLLHLVKEWKIALHEISRVTRKWLISIIRRGRSPVNEEYRNLLIACGWKIPHLGIAERELGDMLKPIKSIDITTYEVSVRQSFTFLEQKVYSHQWDIPNEIHECVMQQLKAKSFPEAYCEKVEVLIWTIKSVLDLVQSRKE